MTACAEANEAFALASGLSVAANVACAGAMPTCAGAKPACVEAMLACAEPALACAEESEVCAEESERCAVESTVCAMASMACAGSRLVCATAHDVGRHWNLMFWCTKSWSRSGSPRYAPQAGLWRVGTLATGVTWRRRRRISIRSGSLAPSSSGD